MRTSEKPMSRRLRRERHTIEVMITMYCAAGHPRRLLNNDAPPHGCADTVVDVKSDSDRDGLCPDCAALLDYSLRRIARCSFGEQKPTCARCTVHCFRTDMRTEVRTVMRYSGPRMTIRHPYLAVRHLLDRRGS